MKIFKDLDFPDGSLQFLNKAYCLINLNPDAKSLFQATLDCLIHPNNIIFDELTSKITEITDINTFTLNILLCSFCIETLRKLYKRNGIEEKLNEYIKSLKIQLLSCKAEYGVWGINECFWQWMFHELHCVRLGRLEFEPFYHFSDVSYKGINKGDRVILIHIPGGAPLDMSEVQESLRVGYEFFNKQFDNKIVPFITHSWILYPPFISEVFKEGGNLQKFSKLFDIIDCNQAGFDNFANIFGCSYPGEDLSKVPQDTSLQRSMLKFIMQGNVMGQGYGIFLYNENGKVK